MGIFSWLLSGPEAEKSIEPKPPIVNEEALPRPVRGLFSELKDFDQIFTEDKRYTAAEVFPNRDTWLQRFKTLLVQLSSDPGSAEMEHMSRLWKEAAKMEKIMKKSSVKIPGGASIYYLKEKMLAYAPEGMEGIAVARGSVVWEGKRVTSLEFLLMDGSRIVVTEDELGSGVAARASVGAEEDDLMEQNPNKEEGGDDSDS